ncbi:MAG: HmuY family protein [Bacteroidota bacterium]
MAFESSDLGLAANEDELVVNINLSRATDKDASIALKLEATGVSIGSEFSTEPAAHDNTISLSVLKGEKHTSFKVIKSNGVLFDGDEFITVSISSAGESLVLGEKSVLKLTFSEILAAQATLELSGGGTNYPNKVFVDLSANRQQAVERASWDLGFYMKDDFKVILNSSTGMMARALDKNDLNTVTPQDTSGFATAMVFANAAALPWIDDPSGDLSKTAIGSVAVTASENKVYIINRGSGAGTPAPKRGWKKIRVIRSASGGYTLQHADINATTFQQIEIGKEDKALFQYIHFENGAVNVEPNKDKWDIAWTYFTNTANFGPSVVPYGFQDIVLLNRHSVQVAKVLASSVSYADFKESDLSALTFNSSQIAIGADWRRTLPAPAIAYEDRFYVVKDADGNYYKLRFLSLTTDGQRGRPRIEFALVKKGI